MDNSVPLASKLRRRMAELVAYPARFDFGRLFADASRVLARAWAPITIGAMALGVAPTVVASLQWWRAPPYTTDDAFQRVWMVVSLAKVLLTLLGHSAAMTYVVAVSLAVLTGANWRDRLQPERLATGFVTSFCVNLIGNWATFADMAITPLTPSYQLLFAIGLAGQLSVVVLGAYFGIAVSAAVAEQLFVGPAIARSFRLLRGLRWRMVGLGLLYLMLLGLAEYGAVLGLSVAGISYRSFGFGQAALSAAPMLVGVVATALFVSFFLQARRIADGPTAGELHDVFG